MTTKKLSLNLKGKEDLLKKMRTRFIQKPGDRPRKGSDSGSRGKGLDLTRREDLDRLAALRNYKNSKPESDSQKQEESQKTDKIADSKGQDVNKPTLQVGAKIFKKGQKTLKKPEADVKETKSKITSQPHTPLPEEKRPESETVKRAKTTIYRRSEYTGNRRTLNKGQEETKEQDSKPSYRSERKPRSDTSRPYGSNFKKPAFAFRKRRSSKPEPVNVKKGTLITVDKKFLTARDLSVLLSEPKRKISMCLKNLGESTDEDAFLKKDVIDLLAAELGHKIKYKFTSAEEAAQKNRANLKKEDLQERPPVVTIMGHIDHGKTTLLDAFRSSSVVDTESGGITQHIGAYQMQSNSGKPITFIDTPGHAAFTAMRMRGAKVTDIVILIVAADDGVNEQTVEAIKHAKAANAPIIVAINKIDKSSANPQKVMSELIQHGIVVEEMGGDVTSVEISAKCKTNLDKLEDAILLQAEFLELKCNTKKAAEGVVVESRLDKRCGAFATLLVKNGELKAGQFIVVGKTFGKVRGMSNSSGEKLKSAPAGMPVEVMGIAQAPEPGSEFFIVKNEKEAKAILDERERNKEESKKIEQDYFAKEKKKLNLVVKADVNGSAEAIVELINAIENQEVEIKVVYSGVGDISESDVMLAKVSDAYIIGFGIKIDKKIKGFEKINVYSIIYDAIEGIESLINKMLAPQTEEQTIGSAEVKEVFILSNKSQVAGCYVKSGFMQKACKVRVIRGSDVIKESSVKVLKYFKEEVKQVKADHECGILLSDFQEVKVGDKLEAFEVIKASQ